MSYLIKLKLKTMEPCLFPKGRERGNHFEGLDFIPGSAVRGALANSMAMAGASNDMFQEIIGHGLLASNFYPSGLIPVPTTIRRCKRWRSSEAHDIGKYSGEAEGREIPFKCSECDSPLVSVKGYLKQDDESLLYSKNAGTTRVITHNKIDRISGTTGTDDGALFSVEVLNEGQVFTGWLQWNSKEQRDLASDYFKEAKFLMLGKMRGRGYGLVKVLSYEEADDTTVAEQYFKVINISRPQNSSTFSLLEDAILLDDYLQSSAFPRNGLDLPEGLELTANGKWTDFHPVHGFNYKRGVIAPVENVLTTCTTFLLEQKLSDDQVKQLEENGIGTRRCDGFGLVICGLADAINPEQDITWEKIDKKPSEGSKELAEINSFIAANAGKFSSLPSKSQLMDIVSAMRNNPQSALELIKSQSEKGTHKKQWDRKLTVNGKSSDFTEWITNLIQDHRDNPKIIEIYIHAIIASEKDKLLKDLWKGGMS